MEHITTNPIITKQFNNELPKPGKTGLDWFLFCYFANLYQNQPMLEIGAGVGGSLCSLLAFTNDLTLIDSWNQNWSKKTIEDCIKKINKQVKFIDVESSLVLPSDLDKYGLIHLDANKSFTFVLQDLDLVAKCCAGIICVDDYMNSMWPEVTWAVDKFVNDNPSWKKILIGNHQIFLSQHNHVCKELIVNFPVFLRNNTICLTYGTLPNIVSNFIEHGKMQYSWHDIAWVDGNNDL